MAVPSPSHPTIVKVGGSLFDLPGLGQRLRAWLDDLSTPYIVLVPGGGPVANAVRSWDQHQHLGDEAAHWLALRALSFNARFLEAIVPGTCVVQHLDECHSLFVAGQVPILDLYSFAVADERESGCLPHAWDVTSDSLAARVAIRAQAAQLILLKSVHLPDPPDWRGAACQGYVDRFFPEVVHASDLYVRSVCFR